MNIGAVTRFVEWWSEVKVNSFGWFASLRFAIAAQRMSTFSQSFQIRIEQKQSFQHRKHPKHRGINHALHGGLSLIK
jgi:hypothetical protein